MIIGPIQMIQNLNCDVDCRMHLYIDLAATGAYTYVCMENVVPYMHDRSFFTEDVLKPAFIVPWGPA